ncbi:MAG: ATP-binding cassette domain-containing protein [Crocinitomicaceae bacterium]|nr:ATP-binding cassette domain-containing protein [Crocinitomicaceae bacterium]
MELIKEAKSYTTTQRFWKLLKPDSEEIKSVYAYSIFSGIVSLSLPLGIQAIINLIQGGQINSAWMVLVFFVVLGIAGNGILQIFQLRITENIEQKIFTRAAFEFAYRIPKIKIEAMYNQFGPELMNRYFDVMNIQKGLSKILISISTAAIQVVFGLILLSLYHPFFIMYSIFLVLFVYFIFRITAKKGLSTSLTESKHKYRLAHWLEEVARTGISFKLAGRTDLPITEAEGHVSNYIDSRENHFKVLIQQYSLLVVFKVVIATTLLAVGGILVMEQVMNIGQFVAAEIIILLVIASVEKLIVSLDVIYDTLTSLEKVGQVTDLELESTDGLDIMKECQTCGMAIDIKNLSFTYPYSNRKTLQNINLSIKDGERLLIAGKNGSGKSTLLHVIAGLYDIKEGVVSYDGLPRDNLNIESLRTIIGTCLDGEDLFEGKLIDNITMGRANATFENVKWAIERLGLQDFVKSLPKGFDSEIQPYGSKLPRSIIQKLIIARAIADKPKILLFEYTFEHIDEVHKRKIVDFITHPSNEWTVIASSSDPYIAQKFDNIVIMDGGEIKKKGNYEELKNELK